MLTPEQRVKQQLAEQQVQEVKILQKVNKAHREGFMIKYPGQVEHCLRLTMERLQLNLDKRGGVDVANADTWPISCDEIESLATAAYYLDLIRRGL